jgi:TRAP-type C4-dicarboxylate transport system substrate-binding protein
VIHNFAVDVEQVTSGRVKLKLYFNGVAGDELEMLARIRHGQLDGALSGHMACERVAPSMRVLRVPGMFQSRDESNDAMNRMQSDLEREAAKEGIFLAGTTGLGPDVIFTRTPVKSMADLRKLRLWRWDVDEVGIAASRAMGFKIVPSKLFEAAKTYDRGEIDGYLAIPAAALAFQWSTQAQFVTDLRGSYLYGCVMFSQRAWQALPVEDQAQIRTSSARIRIRMDDMGRQMDEQLLGGAFQKQGVKVLPVSASFRSEFFSAARQARESLVVDKLVPRALVDRTMQMLADFRAEHGK